MPIQLWQEAPKPQTSNQTLTGDFDGDLNHLCVWQDLVDLVQETEDAVQKLDREHWEEAATVIEPHERKKSGRSEFRNERYRSSQEV